MNARPEAWIHQARNDLALAQLARDNNFLAQACYFASQAAEKCLKGALLELGIEPPHTHVLNDLVNRLKQVGLGPKRLRLCHYEDSAVWRFNRVIRWIPLRHSIYLTPVMPIKPSAPLNKWSQSWKS